MSGKSIVQRNLYIFESIAIVLVFSLTWIGFGSYMSGV